ncbi:MAG TPA: phosphodiester glycosidase family protein [Patescibacteria group bacterium]|nr:phosphodiester glycosidase family protein [Patescibacteria group bacterium]
MANKVPSKPFFHPILLTVVEEKIAVVFLLVVIIASAFTARAFFNFKQQTESTKRQLEQQLAASQKQVQDLQSVDQTKRNNDLESQIKNLQDANTKLSLVYSSLADLRDGKGNLSPLDSLFAQALSLIGKRDYDQAIAQTASLQTKITAEAAKLAAASATSTANVPVVNSAPSSGYKRQQVQTSAGTFLVDIIAADLGSTRVIIDTASDSTCANNCPALPLATYAARSGAFAGINGTYFCPETYPECADKKNAFDQLVMNKNKVYFNSDNNVYSQVPIAIFSGESATYKAHAQDWGRDTGVDGVISNHPPLLLGGQILASTSDPKLTGKGYRGFLGHKGSQVFIGFVRNASFGEAATVLKTLGMDDALNLDAGGSTALWSGGYKLGPGRNIPNVVLFVRK